MPRVLLILATTTYRAEDFLAAAGALGIEVVVGAGGSQALAHLAPRAALELDFGDAAASARRIAQFAAGVELDAIISAEDDGALVAALASAHLGLPHNSPESVALARHKHRMREALAAAGIASPGFRVFSIDHDPAEAAGAVHFPTVLKPVFLSASRGVIRADDETEFIDAFSRIAAILREPDVVERKDEAAGLILAEDFIPGAELALEGVLTAGELRVLALFDKPDPLEGPFFEETIYVTPSREPEETQRAIVAEAERAARALTLRHGPLHAELRLSSEGPRIVEVAARAIGGLCARALRFQAGMELPELILRHAWGLPIDPVMREDQAAGVMMIPITEAGVFEGVEGIDEARQVPCIKEITITAKQDHPLLPLPEGSSYLGFIFARGTRPEDVEAALREAHGRLRVCIAARLPVAG